MNYPIDTGIPPPKPRKRGAISFAALPLRLMQPGHSRLIRPEEYGERPVESIAVSLRTHAKRVGVSIRTEIHNNAKHGEVGLRFWKL